MFANPTEFSQGGLATTIDVLDVGLSHLYNLTGQSVRLSGVQLVSVPSAVHLRSATAYTGSIPVGIGRGDLLKYCRKADKPYPLTDFATPPHSASPWYVVMAITFSRPGRYYLGRVKVYYVTAGQHGWQYENLNATMVVTRPPSGAKPVFDVS